MSPPHSTHLSPRGWPLPSASSASGISASPGAMRQGRAGRDGSKNTVSTSSLHAVAGQAAADWLPDAEGVNLESVSPGKTANGATRQGHSPATAAAPSMAERVAAKAAAAALLAADSAYIASPDAIDRASFKAMSRRAGLVLIAVVCCLTVVAVAIGTWLLTHSGPALRMVLPAVLLCEAAFACHWVMIFRRLNSIPAVPLSVEHGLQVWERMMHNHTRTYVNLEALLQKWHWGTPCASLTRSHIASFLSYGFFYRTPQELADLGHPQLPQQLVSDLEEAWNLSFKDDDADPASSQQHLADAPIMLAPPGASSGNLAALADAHAGVLPHALDEFNSAVNGNIGGDHGSAATGHSKLLAPVRFMSHLWEGINCQYRPAAFYLGTAGLCGLRHLLLSAMRFRVTRHPGGYTAYTCGLHGPGSGWARLGPAPTTANQVHPSCKEDSPGTVQPAANSGQQQVGPAADLASQELPLLFLHGVGLGILPYIPLVMRLAATGRAVIAVECPHLSMQLVGDVPEVDDVVEALLSIVDGLGVPRFGLVAHSYGSFMASRMVQMHPERVASLTLLDPVCFNMFTGKLVQNFVYDNVVKGPSLTTWFVAREMAHAASVCRRFYWTKLNLWADQLPAHTLVVLSGRDELVAVEETLHMLRLEGSTRSQPVRVLMHPTHCHADFLKDLPWQDTVVQHIHNLHRAATAAEVNAAAAGGPAQGVMQASGVLDDAAGVAATASAMSSGRGQQSSTPTPLSGKMLDGDAMVGAAGVAVVHAQQVSIGSGGVVAMSQGGEMGVRRRPGHDDGGESCEGTSGRSMVLRSGRALQP